MARSEKNTGIDGTKTGGAEGSAAGGGGGSTNDGSWQSQMANANTYAGLGGAFLGGALPLAGGMGGIGAGALGGAAGLGGTVATGAAGVGSGLGAGVFGAALGSGPAGALAGWAAADPTSFWNTIDPYNMRSRVGKSAADQIGPAPTPHNYPTYGSGGGGGGYGGPGGPGGGGGLYPGQDESYYSGLRGEYANMIGGLDRNVDSNDPAMMAAMQNAREASARQAKLRGLSGPSSIGMSERDAYTAGLGYQQQENARRQALRAQLMGQYGNMLGGRGQLGLGYGNLGLGYSQLGEQGRQFDVGLMRDIDKENQARYDAQWAAINAPWNAVPGAGPYINAISTSGGPRR